MTTTCPEVGAWRAWLDREDASILDEHLEGCAGCQRLVAELREDAADVHGLLTALAPTRLPDAAEVALARERMEWRSHRQPLQHTTHSGQRLEPVPVRFSRISTPWRVAASGLAAALAITVIVAFTPGGASTAAAFLAQFRSQQVTPIAITPQSQAEILKALNSLGNLGTINVPGAAGAPNPARPETVARAAEAQPKPATLGEAADTVGRANFLLPDPASLPGDVSKTPQVRIIPSTVIRFTFDKKKAQAYYQSSGHPEVSLPDKFDGATLVVTMPSAAVLEYASSGSNKNNLIIGEAGEVQVDVEGKVSLSELRDFLLGLPGLPADVVSQLKAIDNWSNTLPLPVPVNLITANSATIDGAPGLLLNDNSGIGSVAIWHANNHLYGVAGSLKANDLKRIADTLAVR